MNKALGGKGKDVILAEKQHLSEVQKEGEKKAYVAPQNDGSDFKELNKLPARPSSSYYITVIKD